GNRTARRKCALPQFSKGGWASRSAEWRTASRAMCASANMNTGGRNFLWKRLGPLGPEDQHHEQIRASQAEWEVRPCPPADWCLASMRQRAVSVPGTSPAICKPTCSSRLGRSECLTCSSYTSRAQSVGRQDGRRVARSLRGG